MIYRGNIFSRRKYSMPTYSLGNEFLFIYFFKVFPAVLTALPTRRYNDE